MRLHVSSTVRSCSVAVLLLVPAIVPARAAERVACSGTAVMTTCRIDEPNVTRRLTAYPQITFQPGDQVTVSAGGCVQTGGMGTTWKRHVNPSGPNSDRLYYGLIELPGVHSDLVHIAGVLAACSDPGHFNPNSAILRLGYVDDDYSDEAAKSPA